MDRKVTITEHNRTAEAVERLFPQPRWAYLRSALRASVLLHTGGAEFLGHMDNQAWLGRVRDGNVDAYRATRTAR